MDKKTLSSLVEAGHSIRKIATITGKAYTPVRRWLKIHGLRTKAHRDKKFSCRVCGVTGDENFYPSVLLRKQYRPACKSCNGKETVKRYRACKAKAVAYKGGKCERCGYMKFQGALEFHHRNPREKDPSWIKLRTKPFHLVKKELDKCDLLCANCHAEVHWK
jgi:hypothetical protein